MRVTIDLEKEIIIVPDNFFARIAEENEKVKKYGGTPVGPIERIKTAFDKAMGDTDARLLTQSAAKTTTRTRKPTAEVPLTASIPLEIKK